MIKYTLDDDKLASSGGKYTHLCIDVDDMEDEDLLVHFARCVRFIQNGLYPVAAEAAGNREATPEAPAEQVLSSDAATRASSLAGATSAQLARLNLKPAADRRLPGPQPTGAVFVHCAMGKSRSVSVIIAYLLWKYPHRFGAAESKSPDRESAAALAVSRALKWVRESRGIAEPNEGFMRQLELWWEMGRPADSDDAVERHPTYQRWLYKKEVEDSVRLGKAPDWIIFEDEAASPQGDEARAVSERELRCKMCRRVLATGPFVVPHVPRSPKAPGACPHFFVEPLSWMRPVLEEGGLDGRLVCPNTRCGATVGRYSWQGFKCSCDEWVCPAFSLQRSRVDDIASAPRDPGPDPRQGPGLRPPPRSPPAVPKENL